MIGIATYNGYAPPSRITASSATVDAIITLPDGRRIVLDEGWRVEAGGTIDTCCELREIALVRDGTRITFAVKMVKTRSVKRMRMSERTAYRRHRTAVTNLNSGLELERV